MLWRSPLAFFPPVLAMYEWATEYRFSFKAYRKQFVILCVVPYLFLLPWIAMNWTIHHRLIIFEKGAASSNIISGALGLVQNIEGDLNTLVNEPFNPRNEGAALGWAFRQVLRHPLRFARAYVSRMKLALDLHPLLVLFAVAGLWVFRKRRVYRELALMAAYFLGIHCFMTVEERYFWPLIALLAMLACSLPAGLLMQDEPRDDSPEHRFASAFLKGALALAVTLALYTHWIVLSFASQGRGDLQEQLSAALQSNPDDMWLLCARGNARFRWGYIAGAAADFSRAAGLKPEYPESQLLSARAEALLGNPSRLLAWIDPASLIQPEANILQACEYIHMGRKGEALAHLKAAWKIHIGHIIVRGPQYEHEKQVLGKLRSSDNGFIVLCRRLQGPRPAAEKLALNEALTEIVPDSREIYIERGILEARMGARNAALKSLARAEALRLDNNRDDKQQRRIAYGYGKLKEYDRCINILASLTRQYPTVAAYYVDKARCEHLKGSDDAALADLRTAIQIEPKFLRAHLTLGGIHAARGHFSEAVQVRDKVLFLLKNLAADDGPLRETVLAEREYLLQWTSGNR